jgi:anaerobic selenocysteine-containing dehydrogenase
MGTSNRTHYRACNLCEAICGLEILVEGDQIISIRGDRKDPLSQGHICPKAVSLQDIHNDPDRLKHPMRRNPDGDWEQVSWRAALDETADRLGTTQREFGRDAVAVYIGNPAVHNSGTMLFGPSLWRALRTKNRFSATSVDQLPHHLAAMLMFGHQLLLPVPDVDRTGFLLILGANPAVSNGSMMTAPGMSRRIKEIRRRGGRVVVIDPRRTETADLADTHFFIRPGTDALLLMALAHVVFAEDLVNTRDLSDHISSLDRIRECCAPFSPDRVSLATGLSADEIRALARDFAAADSAVCYGRIGVSTHPFGSVCQWLVNVLNIITGNFDRPGGAMFTRPAVDLLRTVGPGSVGRWSSRVSGLPAFGGELPVAVLAEEILTEGEGQIRSLVTVAGNPVLSTPNGRQLDRALEGLDFMVSVDLYLNETTRHAHLILPPTGPLEHDHYDLVFNLLAVRNSAKYSPPLFDPADNTMHDWQIFEGLRQRLDRRPVGKRARTRVNALLGPRRVLDLGLRSGPYGAGVNPLGRGLSLRTLERSPHGIDLGPLEPCLPERLRTRDRRIDLAPELVISDLPRLERLLEETARPDGDHTLFLLVGRRQLRSNNSWMHNFHRLVKGRERCTVLIHPIDAQRLGVESGQRVRIRSAVGTIEAPAEVSDEIMPGVVSLPHGWGHNRDGVGLSTATKHPGVSFNDVTDETALDPVIGTSVLSGVPVQLRPTAADTGTS